MLLGVVGLLLSTAAFGQHEHLVDSYNDVDSNRGLLIVAFATQALSALLLAPVLRFLYRASAYRDPDTAPRAALPLATLAPVVLGIAAMALGIVQLDIIDKVVDALPLSEEGVEDIETDERSSTRAIVLQSLATAAALALAAAFILVSRFARRAGLLSGFMSTLGVIAGAILVLGPLLGQVLGALPMVQWFWLGAVATLFLGHWPGGRGPAWETGEADPWPTAQEVREAREAESGGGRPRRGREPEEEPEEEYEDLPDDEPAAPAHPRSKKRKRKRRR